MALLVLRPGAISRMSSHSFSQCGGLVGVRDERAAASTFGAQVGEVVYNSYICNY